MQRFSPVFLLLWNGVKMNKKKKVNLHRSGPQLFISLVMTNYTVPLQASSSPQTNTNFCHLQPIRELLFTSFGQLKNLLSDVCSGAKKHKVDKIHA